MKENIEKTMKAAAIYLYDSVKPLKNRSFRIIGDFVEIAKSDDDPAPTWYNVREVFKLEGVTPIDDAVGESAPDDEMGGAKE